MLFTRKPRISRKLQYLKNQKRQLEELKGLPRVLEKHRLEEIENFKRLIDQERSK